jgi:Lon protease-like protein
MGDDVVAGDGLLVVVLLQPGWQRDYYGEPPVHEIATLGKVESHERLPDGRMNVALSGLERVRLLPAEGEERVSGKLYRARPIEPAPERFPDSSAATTEIASRLRSLWKELTEKSGAGSGFPRAGDTLPFAALVNQLASAVDVPVAMKQRLLEEGDLLTRASVLETYVDRSLSFWRTLSVFRRLVPDDPRVN